MDFRGAARLRSLGDRRCRRRQALFLSVFGVTGDVKRAATVTRIGRRRHYHWMRQDPEYRQAFEEVAEDNFRKLREKAFELAVTGWDAPVFYRGRQCGTRRRYSERLLVWLLDIYRGPLAEAEREFTDQLRDEAIRRGFEGWEEPLFYKGLQVATERRYSDRLLMAMLEIMRPDLYAGPSNVFGRHRAPA